MTIFTCILTMKPPQAQSLIEQIERTVGVTSDTPVFLLEQGFAEPVTRGDGTRSHKMWSSSVNLGCAGGRQFLVNRVIEHGLNHDDIVIFLDDDILVKSATWRDNLIAPIVDGYADICGVAGMKMTDGFYTRPCEPGEPVDYVSGGWCAIRGTVFLSGIQFDMQFNPNYYEDVSLNFEARARGFRIVQCGRSGLHHEYHLGDVELCETNRQKFIAKWGGK